MHPRPGRMSLDGRPRCGQNGALPAAGEAAGEREGDSMLRALLGHVADPARSNRSPSVKAAADGSADSGTASARLLPALLASLLVMGFVTGFVTGWMAQVNGTTYGIISALSVIAFQLFVPLSILSVLVAIVGILGGINGGLLSERWHNRPRRPPPA